jgi:hypothetical protein
MEMTVVAVVMLDLHSMHGGILIKDAFGCDWCFCQQIINLKVDRLEAGGVVDEDGGPSIAHLCEFTF